MTAKCVNVPSSPALRSGLYASTCPLYYTTACKTLYSISN